MVGRALKLCLFLWFRLLLETRTTSCIRVLRVSLAVRNEERCLTLTDSSGTLVLIHGSVLHKSERNTSEKTRYAYTFHMIESAPLTKYDEKNWLQPTQETPFSKLFASH